MPAQRIGLYLHVPFCQAKCAYCDFASVAGRADLYAPYAAAVAAELRCRPGLPPNAAGREFQAETIYIGGGTPSILPLDLLQSIFAEILAQFAPPAGAEMTLEVNPGTVDAPALAALRRLGVNRLSVGVQSFDDAELRRLGRIHDRTRAIETLRAARQAGFDNLNLDLIFGLPAQTLADWRANLDAALERRPDHISLYALTLEEGTPLAARVAAGALPAPDDDLAAEMYVLAEERLAQAGFEHYEISNWAQPGRQAQHNVNTWRNGDYLGFGPAAHSHLGRRRWWNARQPEAYIAAMQAGRSPVAGEEDLDLATDMGETMMLGLRLLQEGVEVERFRARYGRTPAQVYGAALDELAGLGLIEVQPERVRLTPRGRLLGNRVFARFLP
jgi:oxygen-independent coproporphyrinogen-3 oxidase